MSKLDHANLLQKQRVFREGNDFAIVQDYGYVLADELERSPSSEIRSAMITKQMLLALEYLHQEGLVHRAVNSENVLLKHPIDFYGETQVKAKLCDQGMIIGIDGAKEIVDTAQYF